MWKVPNSKYLNFEISKHVAFFRYTATYVVVVSFSISASSWSLHGVYVLKQDVD